VKVTLQDIAKELDISSATVSLALRDDPTIHPDTRIRVNEVANRLNYKGSSGRPTRGAQKVEISALGLLLSAESMARARNDANFVLMMDGIMAEADKRGYLLNVQAIRSDEARRMADGSDAVPSLIRKDVCQAVIIRGPYNPQDVAYMASQLPVVSMGRSYRGSNTDTVLADNMGMVRSLVLRLHAAGHRRMAWVSGSTHASFFEERQAGFIAGCVAGGLDLSEQRFFGPEIFTDTSENHHIAEPKIFADMVRSGTTAFVCGNDSIASQVIISLEREGFKVPQNVSVTGFDAVPARSTGNRQITGVDPHFVEIGRAAVRLVVQRMEQPDLPPQTVIVQADIVDGETISVVDPSAISPSSPQLSEK